MIEERPKQLFADMVRCEAMITEDIKNDPTAQAAIRDQLANQNMQYIEEHYANKPILKIQHREIYYPERLFDLGEFIGEQPIIAVLITDVWVQPVTE